MKPISVFFLVLVLLILGCTQTDQILPDSYSFSSASDTLRLHLHKEKGTGLFGFGYRGIQFFDTTELEHPSLQYPQDITNMKISSIGIDFKPFFLELYQKGEIDSLYPGLPLLLKSIEEGKIDTTNMLASSDYSLYLLGGEKNGENIFVVDENGNKDFRDDSIRLVSKLEPKSTNNLIKCTYPIYNDTEFVIDSGWIKLGVAEHNPFAFGEAFHHTAKFTIDENEYEIGVFPKENGGFTFATRPILALLAPNDIEADLLPLEMRIKKKNIYN